MGRTLILTSPLEQGLDVLATQRLMRAMDGSPYHVYAGQVDGVYGPVTAAAVRHGKYVLGYPLSEIDEQAGDLFRGLLGIPVAKLPEDYQARRAFRLKPPAGKTPRELALARALSQAGYVEQGGPDGKSGNLTKFGEWYGVNGVSWCMIFQAWAGDPYEPVWAPNLARYAYVPYMLADALAHRYGMSVVAAPIPGDLVLYFWQGLGVPGESHVGRIISGTPAEWEAVEGNTSPQGATGSQGNGGGVYRRTRTPAEAAAHFFIRIGS